MNTFGIAFIFAVTIVGIVGEECPDPCINQEGPLFCGYGKICNFEAQLCDLDYATCFRRINNVTDFIKVTEGKCPDPVCPRIVIH